MPWRWCHSPHPPAANYEWNLDGRRKHNVFYCIGRLPGFFQHQNDVCDQSPPELAINGIFNPAVRAGFRWQVVGRHFTQFGDLGGNHLGEGVAEVSQSVPSLQVWNTDLDFCVLSDGRVIQAVYRRCQLKRWRILEIECSFTLVPRLHTQRSLYMFPARTKPQQIGCRRTHPMSWGLQHLHCSRSSTPAPVLQRSQTLWTIHAHRNVKKTRARIWKLCWLNIIRHKDMYTHTNTFNESKVYWAWQWSALQGLRPKESSCPWSNHRGLMSQWWADALGKLKKTL